MKTYYLVNSRSEMINNQINLPNDYQGQKDRANFALMQSIAMNYRLQGERVFVQLKKLKTTNRKKNEAKVVQIPPPTEKEQMIDDLIFILRTTQSIKGIHMLRIHLEGRPDLPHYQTLLKFIQN